MPTPVMVSAVAAVAKMNMASVAAPTATNTGLMRVIDFAPRLDFCT
jgi:hypothetical protein